MLIAFLIIAAVLSYLFYFQRKTPHGMLDFKTAMMLHFLPKDSDIDIQQTRKLYDKLTERKNKQDTIVINHVEDSFIDFGDHKIRCRTYDNFPEQVKPIIIYIHGGGWSIGSIETHERTCKKIATATNYRVVSVNYSLAPEHPFPQAMHECTAVVEHIYHNSKEYQTTSDQIVIMGDSAGAHLAISTALYLIDQGKPYISTIGAVYPVIDVNQIDTPSYQKFEKGYFLTKSMMRKFIDFYVPDPNSRTNPLASLSKSHNIQSLPSLYLITAQFDPLSHEGESFANQAREAGVDVVYKMYEGVIHGFFANPLFGSKGDMAVEEFAQYLHQSFTLAYSSEESQ